MRYGGDTRRWEDLFLAWGRHIKAHVGERTAARYAMSIKQIVKWLAGRRLAEIDRALIGEVVNGRRAARAGNATIRRDLTALSSALTYAETSGWLPETWVNPTLSWRRMTKERRDPITLPRPQDVALVLAEAGGMAGIIRAARATGARQDELVRANRGDLDGARKTLTIQRGKGNKRRTIDVAWCWDLFAGLPAGIADKALLLDPDTGERWVDVSARFHRLTARVARLAEKDGHPFVRFRFHDLRHLFAVEFLRDGRGSIYDLQRHLGHSSIKVTEMYLEHLTPEQAERAKSMRRSAQNPEHERGSSQISR